MIYLVLYIPGGAGFLPSTVLLLLLLVDWWTIPAHPIGEAGVGNADMTHGNGIHLHMVHFTLPS